MKLLKPVRIEKRIKPRLGRILHEDERGGKVVEMIGMESNRLRQARTPRVQRTISATLKTLQAQLAELDYEINDPVRGSPVWRGTDDLLTSVPGVGDVTARTLIADLPERCHEESRRVFHRMPCSILSIRNIQPTIIGMEPYPLCSDKRLIS